MTDDELRSMLREWESPRAPETLRSRVLPSKSSWGWLLGGDFRIPIPVALALLCLLVFGGYRWLHPPATGSLSDFEQVTEFQPRIVRTTYETR